MNVGGPRGEFSRPGAEYLASNIWLELLMKEVIYVRRVSEGAEVNPGEVR